MDLQGILQKCSMLVSTEYSDVTIVCEDDIELKAHKVVLSSCSPLLKAKIDEVNSGEVEINMKEINHTEMEKILKFMYLGNAAKEVIAFSMQFKFCS